MSGIVLLLAPLDGAALQFFLDKESVPLSQLSFVTDFSQIESSKEYKKALISVPSNQSSKAGEIVKHIGPGAQVYILEADVSSQREADLPFELVMSGLISPVKVDAFNGVMFASTTPTWSVGTKDTIKIAAQPKEAFAAKWSLAAGGEDEELIDEDELLGQTPAPAPTNPDDCEVGRAGKKACKNCTCGRAEAEEAGKPVVLTQEMLDNPQSGCGSCGLGDAFRCAGCPYRGLPAFEMGKKIQLDVGSLAADV